MFATSRHVQIQPDSPYSAVCKVDGRPYANISARVCGAISTCWRGSTCVNSGPLAPVRRSTHGTCHNWSKHGNIQWYSFQIHADRKGALAYATSSTLGAIYVVMAAGYINEALALAMGHASFRIVQVLQSPGSINDAQSLTSALDGAPWPNVVPDSLFRLCWGLHRLDMDAHAVNTLHQVSAMFFFQATA